MPRFWATLLRHVIRYAIGIRLSPSALAHAAMRALARGRPMWRRDLWHALLADEHSAGNSVLCRLGLDIKDLRSSLT